VSLIALGGGPLPPLIVCCWKEKQKGTIKVDKNEHTQVNNKCACHIIAFLPYFHYSVV